MVFPKASILSTIKYRKQLIIKIIRRHHQLLVDSGKEIISGLIMKFFYLFAIYTLCIAVTLAKPTSKMPIPASDDNKNVSLLHQC